jgi:hypothetical protein
MQRMTPTIPAWSAATMPTPTSIGWYHAYPDHWDQQQILVPTAGINLSQSLTLTSGAQGKTKFRAKSTKTYNSQLGSCLSNHSPVHHKGTKITFRPCIQMHKEEVLALQNLLYICISPIRALDTVTSQNSTATLLVVFLSRGKLTWILLCLLP